MHKRLKSNKTQFKSSFLRGFEITNNNWNINIQGATLTIGDNISALGNVVFNTQTNGGRSIVYQYCDGCNNFLSLYIDNNNKVTKIVYVEQT